MSPAADQWLTALLLLQVWWANGPGANGVIFGAGAAMAGRSPTLLALARPKVRVAIRRASWETDGRLNKAGAAGERDAKVKTGRHTTVSPWDVRASGTA